MISVPVELSPGVYARLRDLSHARGETVTSLLEAAAYRIARRDITTDEVGVLWSMGFTDRQIAYELDWTNHKVAAARQRLQLPANKKAKGTTR